MLKKVKEIFSLYNLLPVAIFMFLITAIVNPSFLTSFSVVALFQDIAIFGFLVLGEALVVISKGIDLSVGNMASMSSVIAAWVMIQLNGSVPDYVVIVLSVIIPIISTSFFGFINGITVAYLNIPPLIATLGMMWIVKGIGYYFLRGVPTPYKLSVFRTIFAGSFPFIPYSLIYFLIVTIILHFALAKLKWGRYIYATGGNEYAAFISGVNVKNVKLNTYILSGFFAGFAGILVGAYSAVGYPRACDGYELNVIAAVVMGGVYLTGGEGRLWNAILGIFILRILNKIVLFSGLSGYIEGMIIGSIIIIMLIISSKARESKLIGYNTVRKKIVSKDKNSSVNENGGAS